MTKGRKTPAAGPRWKTDDRPARGGWAPGEYIHPRCAGALCKDLEDSSWVGAKRAIVCADCAYALPEPTPSVPLKVTETPQIVVIGAPSDDVLGKILAITERGDRKAVSPSEPEALFESWKELNLALIEIRDLVRGALGR